MNRCLVVAALLFSISSFAYVDETYEDYDDSEHVEETFEADLWDESWEEEALAERCSAVCFYRVYIGNSVRTRSQRVYGRRSELRGKCRSICSGVGAPTGCSISQVRCR